MNLWIKATIFGSLFMVCLYSWNLSKAGKETYTADAKFAEPIPILHISKRVERKAEDYLVNLPEHNEPFRQLFFETMTLKGIMKDSTDRWIAIFTDDATSGDARLMKFAAGDVHDGITLQRVDAQGCSVKYGSIERRFEVK